MNDTPTIPPSGADSGPSDPSTDQSPASPPEPPTEPPVDYSGRPANSGAGEWRALRRSRSDRYVAGVLGGLARRLDVDPLILRIATVVLAMFGVGIMLYALGWLLIPAEDEDASVAEQALGRGGAGRRRSDAVLLSLGLGLLVLIFAGGILTGWAEGAILLVLAVCGIALLLRQDDHRRQFSASDSQATELTSALATDADTSATWTEGPDWDPARPWDDEQQDWDPYTEPAAKSAAAEPRRPGSSLWLLTVSAAAVALGAIAINDAIWATVAPATYIATALGIVGLGLLVGAWFGRSRGLIALGIVLSFAMVPAVIADHADLRGEDALVRPTTVAGIPAGTQEHGAGEVRYDLSGVEFTDTDAVTLVVDQGFGELTVILPADVDAIINADVGVGEIDALDSASGGFGREARIVDDGADGPGGGELELQLDLGAGQIEVRRAAA
jgi:phage shock protein PspC (stress-responsive transcriptional regulator)